MDVGLSELAIFSQPKLHRNWNVEELKTTIENENSANYLKTIEIKETQTTKISSRLNAERQNAPLCRTKPYEINFSSSSIVKTAVKK